MTAVRRSATIATDLTCQAAGKRAGEGHDLAVLRGACLAASLGIVGEPVAAASGAAERSR
jgi:hypothetical protein